MGKILKFPQPKRSRHLEELKALADAIDKVVLAALDKQELDAEEVVGLLAHRTGTLMGQLARKKELWSVCERVLKKQAILD